MYRRSLVLSLFVSTVFADSSYTSSPSIPGETQSADTPDQPFKEGKGNDSRSEAHTATESISKVPGIAVPKSTATRFEDEEGSLINTSKTQHWDVSAPSAAGELEDVHEVPSATSEDVQQEAIPSYPTMDGQATKTSTQSYASTTSAGAESITVNEEAQSRSQSPKYHLFRLLSVVRPNRRQRHHQDCQRERQQCTRRQMALIVSRREAQAAPRSRKNAQNRPNTSRFKSSGGANTSLASNLTTDTATSLITQPKEPGGSTTSSGGTTITEGSSTQTKSAYLDTASDETTSSLDMVLEKTTTEVIASTNTGSADQTGGQTTTLSTETKTTLTTSASKKTSGPTTTTNLYDEK
ncbi:hypothetical protein FOQG_15918 [Fusarium oxysporum f. sp. raphani 54005]|uniref:Uncharacterized protein n=1 Tax=Fusarium oxysporum f. sp. raphani 54005 TaxID=1089458 RepID=X0BBE5_FUSOX|nr:hypothetical protein FOQG_15918 [Fusarium oxysporum f. sp. raphani 54005]